MKVKCYKCNHEWDYKGQIIVGKVYITCANCYRKIRIDKAEIKEKLPTTDNLLLTTTDKTKIIKDNLGRDWIFPGS